jgi:hypothetical protein
MFRTRARYYIRASSGEPGGRALASIGVPLGTFIFWGVSRLPVGWLLGIDFALVTAGRSPAVTLCRDLMSKV